MATHTLQPIVWEQFHRSTRWTQFRSFHRGAPCCPHHRTIRASQTPRLQEIGLGSDRGLSSLCHYSWRWLPCLFSPGVPVPVRVHPMPVFVPRRKRMSELPTNRATLYRSNRRPFPQTMLLPQRGRGFVGRTVLELALIPRYLWNGRNRGISNG